MWRCTEVRKAPVLISGLKSWAWGCIRRYVNLMGEPAGVYGCQRDSRITKKEQLPSLSPVLMIYKMLWCCLLKLCTVYHAWDSFIAPVHHEHSQRVHGTCCPSKKKITVVLSRKGFMWICCCLSDARRSYVHPNILSLLSDSAEFLLSAHNQSATNAVPGIPEPFVRRCTSLYATCTTMHEGFYAQLSLRASFILRNPRFPCRRTCQSYAKLARGNYIPYSRCHVRTK